MSEHQTNPKFDIFLDKAGEFRFRLHAANGQIVLASEGYTTKQNCIHGIQSVKENSRLVDSFYADTAKDGSFYFGLKVRSLEEVKCIIPRLEGTRVSSPSCVTQSTP